MFRIRSFFKELEPTRQMSEAFRNCIFLALSGGFQDAYTYFTRDGVFANAQTGNVVLMSTNFMTGKWEEGLKYLFPILAFALGVLVADLIQKKFKYFKKIHWRQGILLFEIIILFHAEEYGYRCGGNCIVFLCNAGSDFQKSQRIFLCQYNVYR